jgi:hypothetical protein
VQEKNGMITIISQKRIVAVGHLGEQADGKYF